MRCSGHIRIGPLDCERLFKILVSKRPLPPLHLTMLTPLRALGCAERMGIIASTVAKEQLMQSGIGEGKGVLRELGGCRVDDLIT